MTELATLGDSNTNAHYPTMWDAKGPPQRFRDINKTFGALAHSIRCAGTTAVRYEVILYDTWGMNTVTSHQ